MTAISIVSFVTVLATIVVPILAVAERIEAERNNPLRKLKVRTRRSQAPSASGSFV